LGVLSVSLFSPPALIYALISVVPKIDGNIAIAVNIFQSNVSQTTKTEGLYSKSQNPIT
jgi:hypothetical protein